MSTTTGTLHLAANLVAGVHEAAGASLGNEDYVFGGKAAAVTSTVQSFPVPSARAAPASPTSTTASPTTTTVASATATGALPQPRAGSVAVTIGTTVYIVGGYAGLDAEPAVLATSDGGTFTTVAKLPVAVRDPAVATAGGVIYVFGGARRGQAAATPASHAPTTSSTPTSTTPTSTTSTSTTSTSTTSTSASKAAALTWVPVADIQRVDPVTGRATVVGQLPMPLEGAAAVTLDGSVYIAGGRSPAGLNGIIWGFEPPTASLIVAGHLVAPVWGAGVATVGSTAWLVGGESGNGQPVGSLQTFRPKASSPPPPPAPGSSRPTGAGNTSPVPTG